METPAPLVSFVVPVYRGATHLRETLDSIARQTLPNVEAIVVDDGSPDDSAEIAAAYGPPVRLVRQRNMGVCVARNHGLAEARGRFVTFLDQDDLVGAAYAREMSEALLANPELGAAWCEIGFFHGRAEGNVLVKRSSYAKTGRTGLEQLKRGMMVSPGCAMFRKEAAQLVGGFDPSLANVGEDYDFFLKVALYYEFRLVPKLLYFFRQHPESNSNNWRRMYRPSASVVERFPYVFEKKGFDRADLREARAAVRTHYLTRGLRGLRLAARARKGVGSAAYDLLSFVARHPELLAATARVPRYLAGTGFTDCEVDLDLAASE